MNRPRRYVCASVLAGIGGLFFGSPIKAQDATKSGAKERVIKIHAKKFSYTPNRIELKKGVPVTLEFTSVDFVHGFKIPDLNIRADLTPGRVTKIRLLPDQVGEFDFLCDNFCGSGHEEMNGKMLVRD